MRARIPALARIPDETRVVLGWGLAALAVAVILVQVGRIVPHQPVLAGVVALGVLALGLSLAEPAVIPLAAMPTLAVLARVGGQGLNLSVSDVALFVAFWPAVFLAKRPFSPPLRALLWLSATYQAATLFTVVANPYRANVVEWFHAWLLVAGALVVGWAVGRAGYAKAGLSALLVATSVIAVITIVQGFRQYAQGDLGPVYLSWPYGMHKNFVGTVLAFSAVIAYARPLWLGWSKPWALTVFWLSAAGVVFSQSRQGLISVGVALLVISLRSDPVRRRSKVIVLAVVPAVLFVGSLVRDEVQAGNVHSSIFQRLTWFEDTLTVVNGSPLFGAGLRYWTAGRTDFGFQPPNAELEVLASAGVIGLIGFLVAFIGALVVLWRVDPRYGTLAFAIVLTRLVQGQFDLFWVAVQVSIPFVVVGICLGVQALDSEASRLTHAMDGLVRSRGGHEPSRDIGPGAVV